MRVERNLLLVMTLLTTIVIAGGCGSYSNDYSYDKVPTERVIVENRNTPNALDIMEMNQRRQMINMMEHEQSMKEWDRIMDRMHGTMGSFGRSLDEANRMRQRNSRRSWSD